MLKFSKTKPKILFVASEAAPFVKIGGLGEVMYSLPKALRELGYDARVMIPRYAEITAGFGPFKTEVKGLGPFSENDTNGLLISNVLSYESENEKTYFLENMEYYEKRANVYGYGDDTVRWVLLSKACLEFIKKSDWKPDIIVASDWETGFVPNLLKTDYKDDPILKNIKTLFCIHNLGFQGLIDHHFVSEMDFDAGQSRIPDFFDEKILKLNGMRRGIMYADLISTVSPTYAKEILCEKTGEKLNDLLTERRSSLYGILNGIDMTTCDPLTDPDVPFKYSLNSISKRTKNKLSLQEHFGLKRGKDEFLIGIVSRMHEQKGFDLLIAIIESLLESINFQLVTVGTGDNHYRTFFQELQQKYPDRIAGHYFFDRKIAREIFSGADAILIPSRFEPSGLVQLEAMRYGAVPIVRKTGGLADSVSDYVPGEDIGTGFVFEKYDQFALLIAIIRASETFKNKEEWSKLAKRAMKEDFSWKKSALKYGELFDILMKKDGLG